MLKDEMSKSSELFEVCQMLRFRFWPKDLDSSKRLEIWEPIPSEQDSILGLKGFSWQCFWCVWVGLKTYISNCYGEDQHISRKETALRVQEMEDYMLQRVFVEEKYAKIRAKCKNRDKECSFWAVIGGKNIT
jgi:hypothetical protein